MLTSKDSDQPVQADMSLCWAHISEGTFSHVVAYIHTRYSGIGQKLKAQIIWGNNGRITDPTKWDSIQLVDFLPFSQE